MRRFCLATVLALPLLACGPQPEAEGDASAAPGQASEVAARIEAPIAVWTWQPRFVFPTERSLIRPEDGELLADGRLLVADQVHGLRLLAADGSSRPFGRFAEAGYRHQPPSAEGAPNGVSITPDGQYLLVADVYGGGIYRVALDSEATERVYQHAYGVNTAVADRAGGIWFSQSTENAASAGGAGLFEAVAVPRPDGALLYLPPSSGEGAPVAQRRLEGLLFANGIALDEASSSLYLAETLGNKVLRFRIGADGALSQRTVLAEPFGPDNLELGADGRLWVALPISNELMEIDLATGGSRIAFSAATPTSTAVLAQIKDRAAQGQPWLDLMAPPLWEPAPGLMTGLILAPDGRPAYWTGLGDALIRLDEEAAPE